MKYEYKFFDYSGWLSGSTSINERASEGFRVVNSVLKADGAILVIMEREIQEDFKSEPI